MCGRRKQYQRTYLKASLIKFRQKESLVFFSKMPHRIIELAGMIEVLGIILTVCLVLYVIAGSCSFTVVLLINPKLTEKLNDWQNYFFFMFPSLLAAGSVVSFFWGDIAHGRINPFDLSYYSYRFTENGILGGMMFLSQAALYFSWAFFMMGHVTANVIKEKRDKRPAYPYIINLLVGIILTQENNIVLKALNFLGILES